MNPVPYDFSSSKLPSGAGSLRAEVSAMANSFADWLCNVMLWSAIVALVVLLYEVFASRGFLSDAANLMTGLVAVAVVAVVAALWPHY
jgi:hypothetical protein